MCSPATTVERAGLVRRAFDVVVTVALLTVLAPVLAAVALAVLVRHGRPIIFRDPRIGMHGRVFELYKFRTMTEDCNVHGEYLRDADRITPLGAFLRRWSLDELPELVNVLRGEMSLVGPRPLPARYRERYSDEQMRRHDTLPGVTGWAQVNGRNAVTWPERFELDAWYQEHQSFALDLKILLLTVGKVVKGDGISAVGHVTMPEFQGDEE